MANGQIIWNDSIEPADGTIGAGTIVVFSDSGILKQKDSSNVVKSLSVASVAWGAISGTLTDQTDLETALDGKQPIDQALTDISGLTLSQGDIFYVNVSGNIVNLGAGVSGQFFKTLGTGNNPLWANPAGNIACCPFGAKSDGTGSFLIANGKSTDGDDSTKPKTRQPIAMDGTLIRLAYKTKDGDTTTQMKIHVNGVVEQTVVLSSMNANDGGVETISVSVTAGDYVEIEYDASQKPGECTMYFIQELS